MDNKHIQRGANLRPGLDYIGLGVGALVFDAQGKLFLAKRGPTARNEIDKWEFPGGTVEFGEKLLQALHREFLEEYGIKIEVQGLLGIFDHILPEEGQHWVSATYIATHASGIPVIREPQKCTEIGWFSLQSTPHPLSQVTIQNIAEYKREHA